MSNYLAALVLYYIGNESRIKSGIASQSMEV